MVRRRVGAVSNHQATIFPPILRDAAEPVIGPRFARTGWRLLRMRSKYSGNRLNRTDMGMGAAAVSASTGQDQMTQAIKTKQPMDAKGSQTAPIAPRRPHSFTMHGITVVDDYAWLKDANWQEVLRDPSVLNPDIRKYLEAENDYTESLLGHTAPLQKTLVAEMRGRIKEDDSSVPAPDGAYAYLRQFREGGAHDMLRLLARA